MIYILIQKAGGKGCSYDRDEKGLFLFSYHLHTVWHRLLGGSIALYMRKDRKRASDRQACIVAYGLAWPGQARTGDGEGGVAAEMFGYYIAAYIYLRVKDQPSSSLHSKNKLGTKLMCTSARPWGSLFLGFS